MYELILRLTPTMRIISQTKHDCPVLGFSIGDLIGLGSPPTGYVVDQVGVQIGTGASGPIKTILLVSPAPIPALPTADSIGFWLDSAPEPQPGKPSA